MFSKAPLKRFNEEINCAPPPTAYNVKLDKATSVSIDKSDRWRESKENTPAPNAYSTLSVSSQAPRTPGRPPVKARSSIPRPHSKTNISSASSLLDVSSTSTLSADSNASGYNKSKFLTPPPPSRLQRTGSCRGSGAERQLAQLTKLKQERDALQANVNLLKQELCSLRNRVNIAVTEAGVQTDDVYINVQSNNSNKTDVSSSVDITENLPFTEANLNKDAPEDPLTRVSDSQSEDTTLVQEKIRHLTQLRDNLEASVARKDEIIAQLETDCLELIDENKLHMDAVDQCNLQLITLEKKISCCFLMNNDGENLDESIPEVENFVCRVAGLINNYESLLQNHTSHTANCTQHLHTLSTTLAALNEKVADYEEEIISLKTEVDERNGHIDGLEETLSELNLVSREKEMMETVMQEEIRQRNREMSMLEEGYTSLEQKVAEAEQRAAAVAEERMRRETSETKVQQLQMALQEAEVLQHFLQKEIMSRELEVTSGFSTVQELTAELEITRQSAMELRGEAEAQLNQVIILKANLAAKDYDIDEKEETIITLKEEVQSKQELADDFQKMLTGHKAAKVELIQNLEEKSSAIGQLEQTIAEVHDNLTNHADKLQQHEKEREVEIACLKDMHEAELEGFKGEKEVLMSRVASLTNECSTSAALVQELDDKLKERKSTISDLEERILDLMTEISDSEEYHEGSISELREELDELSNQYSDTLLEAESRRRALHLVTEQHAQQELLLQAAENDAEKFREQVLGVQENLSSKSEEYVTVEQNLVQLGDKYADLERSKAEEVVDLKNLLRLVEGQLHLSREGCKGLKQEVSTLQSTNTGFITQIKQFRSDLAKKSAAIEESKECIELLREEKNIAVQERDSLMEECRTKKTASEELTARVQHLEGNLLAQDDKFTLMKEQHEKEIEQAKVDKDKLIKWAEEKIDEANLNIERAVTRFTQEQEVQSLVKTRMDEVLKESDVRRDVIVAEVSKMKAETADAKQKMTEYSIQYAELEDKLVSKYAEVDLLVMERVDVESLKMEHEQQLSALAAELNERRQEMDQREKLLSATSEELDQRIAELERQHTAALEESDLWQKKCLALEKLVEPFREQLENYEAERTSLVCTKTAAQQEMDSLSLKYVALLGHHNHKQKIQHVVKLKSENNRLIEEVAKFRVESDRMRKTVRRLEERSVPSQSARRKTLSAAGGNGSVVPGAADKENSGDPGTMRSPLGPSNKVNRRL